MHTNLVSNISYSIQQYSSVRENFHSRKQIPNHVGIDSANSSAVSKIYLLNFTLILFDMLRPARCTACH